MINHNLKLDICKSNNEIISLYNNIYDTLVLGNKFTGKSSIVLKNLAYQTILNKNVGAFFITSTKDLSYEIYTLAKQYKRRILYINPSIDDAIDLAINNKEFKNIEYLYDFEKLIFNNYIVIVDVELFKTKDKGIKFVDFLISKLENSLYNNSNSYHKPFILFVDDAFNYLDSLSNIIYYGNQYNISNILFFQNRNQFKTKLKDYSSFLESNISNLILMNNINHEDIKYYELVFNLDISANLIKKGDVFYSLKDLKGITLNNFGKLEYNPNIDTIINKKLNSIKKSLKNKKSNNKKQSLVKNKDETSIIYSDNINDIKIKQNENILSNNNLTVKNNNKLINNDDIETKEVKDKLKDINKMDENIKSKYNNEESLKANNKTSFLKHNNKIELVLDWDNDF